MYKIPLKSEDPHNYNANGKMMFPLTFTHLRFTVEALTPVRLSGYNAGSQPAQVFSALAYYHDNKQEIDEVREQNSYEPWKREQYAHAAT